jgi:hypothetical protein
MTLILGIRCCGKPMPGFLYQQEPKYVQQIGTMGDDHCGDLFISPPFGPHSILVCEDCAKRHGLIW